MSVRDHIKAGVAAYSATGRKVRGRALTIAKEQARYLGVSLTDVLHDPEMMATIATIVAAEGATGGAATPISGTALATQAVRYGLRRQKRMQAQGFRGNPMGKIRKRFVHDCKACRYLGSSIRSDYYFCPGSLGGTVIARFGSAPNAYSSSDVDTAMTLEAHPRMAGRVSEVVKALRLARKKGFIRGEKKQTKRLLPKAVRWEKGESPMRKMRVKRRANPKKRRVSRDWKPAAGRLVGRVHTVKIYRDSDWQEYVVVPPGAKSDKRCAFTSDREDAIGIANDMASRLVAKAIKARKNPLTRGYSRKSMSANIRREMHAGRPQAQSVAIAYSVAVRVWRKRHPGRPLPAHLRRRK